MHLRVKKSFGCKKNKLCGGKKTRIYCRTGGLDNKGLYESLHNRFRGICAQKMSLICLREGCDDILAMNVNYVCTRGDTYNDEIIAQVSL